MPDAQFRYLVKIPDAWFRCLVQMPDAWWGIKVNISPLNISSVTRNLGSKILRFREGLKLEGLDLMVKSK
jgi:hypothetical protein